MTDKIDQSLTEEIERLRQKNAELLGELKQARAQVKELETQAEQSITQAQTLKDELYKIKLHDPVLNLLDGILVSAKYSSKELGERYQFELNDQGVIEMRELDGAVVEITEKVDGREIKRPIRFDKTEIWRYLSDQGEFDHIVRGSGASGGGAVGSQSSYSSPATAAKPATESKGAGFGLK